MQVSLSILVAAFLAGCAAAGIRPSYLLAPQYQHLTCSQIASEAGNGIVRGRWPPSGCRSGAAPG
jgi:uncharacterized lipoprotein YmbA